MFRIFADKQPVTSGCDFQRGVPGSETAPDLEPRGTSVGQNVVCCCDGIPTKMLGPEPATTWPKEWCRDCKRIPNGIRGRLCHSEAQFKWQAKLIQVVTDFWFAEIVSCPSPSLHDLCCHLMAGAMILKPHLHPWILPEWWKMPQTSGISRAKN